MNRTLPSSVSLDLRRVLLAVWGTQIALLLLVASSELGVHIPLLRPLVTVVYLTFVPGTLVVLALNLKLTNPTRAGLYVVGTSLMTIMVVGGIMSLLYPFIGIQRPISVWPLLGTSLVLVAALSLAVRSGNFTYTVSIGPMISPLPLALVLLPIVSVFGTYVYARFGNNLPLLYLLGGIGLAPILVAIRNRDSRWYGFAVWCIAVALLYHAGLWPFSGGHPDFAITMEQGRWLPNAEEGRGSLLPNAVLFPVYAILAGFSIEAEWSVINPFLVSFLPVALYEIYRTQISSARALIATCIFMFAYPFYVLYPGAGRAATPVLFLALVGLVFTDEAIDNSRKALLTLVFGIGVVVSHYGTAYVVMFALLTGAFIYTIITGVDTYRSERPELRAILPLIKKKSTEQSAEMGRVDAFCLPFLAFYSTLAIAWYLYTAQGVKFRQLPNKVVDAAYGVLYVEASGSAANVVTKEYGSQIVATTRLFYLLLGALMTLGFIYVFYQWFFRRDTLVSNQFYALAAGHFAILGGSALPSGTGFAIARVMMIVFTFSAPFALFGVDWFREVTTGVLDRFPVSNPFTDSVMSSLFAIVLCLFLAMNSGVIVEVTQRDFAPSTKVSDERLVNSTDPSERSQATQCSSCDVNTHVWLYSHMNQSYPAYGDEFVESQTDFYASSIEKRAPFKPSPRFFQSVWTARNGTNESAYLVILPRNEDTQGVYPTKYQWRDYDRLQNEFNQSHMVYRSQQTRIYLTSERAEKYK